MIIEKQSITVIQRALAKQNIEVNFDVANMIFRDLVNNDVPMSKKEMKKARQQFNREATNTMQSYKDHLAQKLEEVNLVLRDKPSYIPSGLWKWLTNKFVDVSKLQIKLSTEK